MSGKGGKGGKGKGAANPDPGLAEKTNHLASLKRQCDAHERMIHVASEQLQRSQLESLNLKKRILELNHKFTKEDQATAAMTHDMFVLYTEMQRKMEERKREHKQIINGLQEQLAEANLTLQRTMAEKDAKCAEKTRQINEQRQLMEQMAISFGVELKDALDKMSRNIKDGERHHSHH